MRVRVVRMLVGCAGRPLHPLRPLSPLTSAYTPPPPHARRYVGKEVLKRGIPHENSCDELVQLIKDHGRWVEPPQEEEGGGGGGDRELVAA